MIYPGCQPVVAQAMPLYIESAQTYLQLAVAALGLTVVFKEKVLGLEGQMRVTRLLLASWACLLSAIGVGAWYQYVAVKWITWCASSPQVPPMNFPLRVFLLRPGPAYFAMVGFFYIGSVLLVLASARQLMSANSAAGATT
ncbi:MAG TPA: hypothetical protein VFS20_15790 [Longimicrobium sp.]|nr:hypothetical protein [Longimicrobium sp.]